MGTELGAAWAQWVVAAVVVVEVPASATVAVVAETADASENGRHLDLDDICCGRG